MFFKTVAPSKCERSKFSESSNKALTEKQIKRIISQFGDAALRVKKAGCDGVELHASHGYLIQQFCLLLQIAEQINTAALLKTE